MLIGLVLLWTRPRERVLPALTGGPASAGQAPRVVGAHVARAHLTRPARSAAGRRPSPTPAGARAASGSTGAAPSGNTFLPCPSTTGYTHSVSSSYAPAASSDWTKSTLPITWMRSCFSRSAATSATASSPSCDVPAQSSVERMTGRDVLRDLVELPGDVGVRAGVVRPVRREDVVRLPAEHERVHHGDALADGSAVDLAGQRRLPPAVGEAGLAVLIRAAGRLRDSVEGGEQVDVDATGHGRLLSKGRMPQHPPIMRRARPRPPGRCGRSRRTAPAGSRRRRRRPARPGRSPPPASARRR